jgi:MFS family permease
MSMPLTVAAPAFVPGKAISITLLLASSLTIMSGATISPSLPAIEAQFQAVPNADLLTRLVLTLPAIMFVLSAPVAGRMTDIYGRRITLILAAILYGFAGMSGLIAESLFGLLAGRAALGIAVSGIMTASTALVGDYFAGSARDRFIGLQIAFNGFGGLIFLLGGGFLADLHWRAPFAIYGLAFLLLPALILFIGANMAEASAPVQKRGEPGKAEASLFSLKMLCLFAFFNFVCFYLLPTQLPYYMRELGIAGSGLAGLAIGLSPFSGAVTSLMFGRLKTRMSTSTLFILGFSVMALGHLILALAQGYASIVIAVAISGLGMGIVMPNFSAAALALAAPEQRGRVVGMLSSSIFLGQFLSPLFSQPIIGQYGFALAFGASASLLATIALATAGHRLARIHRARVRAFHG